MLNILIDIIKVLVFILPIVFCVAFVTIAERKQMASVQRRLGPNSVGYLGLGQPFADAIKLLVKEIIIPRLSNRTLFVIGPAVALICALLGFVIVPLAPGVTIFDFDLGVLVMLAINSLASYGILIASWASNSKYALLSSIRNVAQMLSYELVITSVILITVIFSGSFNITSLVEAQKACWNIIPLFPIMLIFVLGNIAEMGRAPFDIVAGESEIMEGFNIEYSGSPFVFFFLAEYAHLILGSALITVFFLGGWLPFPATLDFSFITDLVNINLASLSNTNMEIIESKGIFDNTNSDYVSILDIIKVNLLSSFIFGFKTIFMTFVFIWIRASFPRVRFDQLMNLGWKVLLPILFAYILFIFTWFYIFDMFNYSLT